jgi:hypothetical protein
MDEEKRIELYRKLEILYEAVIMESRSHLTEADSLTTHGRYEAACSKWSSAYAAESYAGTLSRGMIGLLRKDPMITKEAIEELIGMNQERLKNFDHKRIN